MNNSYVIEARKKLEEFLLTIDDNNIIDICIQDYFNISDAFKRKVKGIRGECINWEYKNVQLDPYVLGLWLGDGCKNGYQYACNGNYDVEIMNYLEKWGETNDCQFKKVQSTKYSYSISSIDNFRKKGESPLKKLLSTYNLVNNKHIPKEYLINSKEVRLKLLAGIIDTDGYVAKDGTIEISQTHKHKRLIDDIVYLSRSLGFYTYVSYKKTNYTYKQTGEKADAYRIKISGDTSEIPTLLPRKKSRSTTQYNMRNSTGIIKIKPIADSNYIGIGIDGNNRFLINDFTVTHNCLNIRDATVSQLMNNEELNNLKQIIGLKTGKEYTNTSDLRYGKVMVLTDADLDGNHITSLIVNMFHAQFPSLIKLDFLQTLRTPIVKATRNGQTVEFFTEQDYHTWKDSVGDSVSRYAIKYFKGLGTSKKEDAQAIFRRFDELKADFYYRDHRCDEAILLAFDKDKNVSKSDANATLKCSDKRKAWLSNYDRNDYLDIKQTKIPYADLINKGLIHFSIYDNVRSIPHLIDGLKPSQRKILWYMLEKNITRDIKVAQLSGYVSAETSYHHGETSLQGAIIGMAQDFVGSNNLPLLTPEGNFGSRFGLGKDAASPRYIFTRLQPWTTTIYDQRDAPLLNYLNDDGQSIEPDYFIPIIPMALVNGCEGIGTGFSTYIPPHNPKDIINNLLLVLDDKDPIPMKPYFRGFNGVLTTGDAHDSDRVGSWVTKGIWKKISSTQIEITELPIGVGITGYKEFLESMIEGCNASNKKKGDSKEKEKTIKFPFKDVKNNTKDENSSISFIVDFKSSFDLEKLINSGTLEKELKLTRSFTTTNMYLFDESLIPTKYLNTTDILLDFYDIRLDMYSRRRTYLIKQLEKELIVLETKVRFISEYISGVLDINRKTKAVIFELLKSRGYPDHPDEHSYEFLIRMQIASLTKEKIEELENTTANKRESLIELQNKSEKDLWKEDLNNLKCHLGQ
jgi:DNA topoisomerase-2